MLKCEDAAQFGHIPLVSCSTWHCDAILVRPAEHSSPPYAGTPISFHFFPVTPFHAGSTCQGDINTISGRCTSHAQHFCGYSHTIPSPLSAVNPAPASFWRVYKHEHLEPAWLIHLIIAFHVGIDSKHIPYAGSRTLLRSSQSRTDLIPIESAPQPSYPMKTGPVEEISDARGLCVRCHRHAIIIHDIKNAESGRHPESCPPLSPRPVDPRTRCHFCIFSFPLC